MAIDIRRAGLRPKAHHGAYMSAGGRDGGGMFRRLANAWMLLRDCVVPQSDRRREMQEIVVADLNTCLEQLQTRTLDMESKVTRCGEQALFHMHQSQRVSATAPARQRDRQRAKGHMEERRRVQQQLDKASLMSVAIQKQIDSIVSSHMDMLIVDAMRGFNYAATNMALPQRATELDTLGDQLADRQSEVATMQDAIMGIGVSMNSLNECSVSAAVEDDGELWRELDDLMRSDSAAVADEYEDDARLLPSVPLTRAYQRQMQRELRKTAVAPAECETDDDDEEDEEEKKGAQASRA